MGRRAGAAVVLVALVGTLVTADVARATSPVAGDGQGRAWRQLHETTGMTWDQVAEVCPRDGATPCAGSVGATSLAGWVWATERQVVELMGEYAPAVLAAEPPSVGGADHFHEAIAFLGDMRWTSYAAGYNFYVEWTAGWTSSVDASGAPLDASAGYGWYPYDGSFRVGGGAPGGEASPYRGVWLWRAADTTPPVVTPSIGGVAGSGGWYVSDVVVGWDVADGESAVESTDGCDPATVTSDGAATFACEATSAGGTSTASTTVRRDATPPTVTCRTPTPVFTVGETRARVGASVADAVSGPAATAVSARADTTTAGRFKVAVVGADLAGNRAAARCPYEVVPAP